MNELELERKKHRVLYRELFAEANKTFLEQLNKLRNDFSCTQCMQECPLKTSEFPPSVITMLPENCSYKEWQKLCINVIKTEIEPDIFQKIENISVYRQEFKCSGCATCCNLACSDYSYEELQEKAKSGDNFAKQFTSVFVPYNSLEEARKIFPDYVDIVQTTMGEEEKIYFYHCPLLTKDNKCSKYEERPEICRDFPENPLSVLPPSCGFYGWKDEVMVAAMTLHAMSYIYKFYLAKIEETL
jgi:Fe-S-cluster containining protein